MEEEKVIEQTLPVEQTPEQPTARVNTTENNLAMMRKKLEAEEQARREYERRAADLEAKLASMNQQSPNVNNQLDEDAEDPEDIVVNKKLKKTTAKITGKLTENEKKLQELQQRLDAYEAQSVVREIEDFKHVVTDENIKTFARLYPEDYETMMANPNPKAKIKTAYNMIKNYGIANVTPILKQTEQIAAINKKIDANAAKPAPAAIAPASNSPLTKFGRYNEEGRLILNDDDVSRINREVRKKLGYG